jgi:hypothetical protein
MRKFDFIEPINASDVQKYLSNLYHWTSIEAAIKILNSQNIYSKIDLGKHANFHVQPNFKDFERSREICLKFKFNGDHKLMFGDSFNTKEAPPNCSNSIYHLILSSWNDHILGKVPFGKLSHWQSNVYPNTEGLVFLGVDRLHENYKKFGDIDTNKEISKPRKLFFLSNESKIKAYDRKIYFQQLKLDLDNAEKGSINKKFTVHP